jgi:hypothetical protein
MNGLINGVDIRVFLKIVWVWLLTPVIPAIGWWRWENNGLKPKVSEILPKKQKKQKTKKQTRHSGAQT